MCLFINLLADCTASILKIDLKSLNSQHVSPYFVVTPMPVKSATYPINFRLVACLLVILIVLFLHMLTEKIKIKVVVSSKKRYLHLYVKVNESPDKGSTYCKKFLDMDALFARNPQTWVLPSSLTPHNQT